MATRRNGMHGAKKTHRANSKPSKRAMSVSQGLEKARCDYAHRREGTPSILAITRQPFPVRQSSARHQTYYPIPPEL
jgi:hypothetical protein